MIINEYAKRLNEWNNSVKYRKEMDFLTKLVNPKKNENILDYGCGTGTFVRYLKQNSKSNIFGYDINYLIEGIKPSWYSNKLAGKYNKIILLHSIAHIPKIEEILNNLKNHLVKGGNIFVLTPNMEFDDFFKTNVKDTSYEPDTTVRKHFTSLELNDLFIKTDYNILIQGQLGKIVSQSIHERLFLVAEVLG